MPNFFKDSLTQNAIGLIILIAVGLMCWPLAPKPSAQVSGILLPSAPSQPPLTVNQVQVLQTMPAKATLLGTVNTKIYYSSMNETQEINNMTASLNYAKNLAAQAGANAIVINGVKSGMIIGQGPLNSFDTQSYAIRF